MDTKTLTKLAETFTEVVDFINKTGPLEQAIAETNARLSAAKAEEQSLAASVANLNADISKLTSKKAEHLTRIDTMLTDATSQAAYIVEEAKIYNKTAKKKADANAESIIVDANARAAEVDKQTDIARQDLADTLAAIENASKERTTLQKAIDNLRAKFS